jgi:hypothetical protein
VAEDQGPQVEPAVLEYMPKEILEEPAVAPLLALAAEVVALVQ